MAPEEELKHVQLYTRGVTEYTTGFIIGIPWKATEEELQYVLYSCTLEGL